MREPATDKHGVLIQEFDQLKVFHFVGARRKKHYMYKWVRRVNGHLKGLHMDGDTDSGYWLVGPQMHTEILQSPAQLKAENEARRVPSQAQEDSSRD